ncbi:MAG: SGNH/GDSL hydrolase family protein [Leptospiraceae bacterium]|nr:SGNH/GDSL hydrolase family protein [Leptospiraceae bacterium]
MPGFRILLNLIILFNLLNCSSEKKEDPIINKQNILLAGLVYYNSQNQNYNSECGSGYGKENSLFYKSGYYDTFVNYKTGTTNLVIGDSTMDISTRYDGYLSSVSKSIAVGGNTLCDMYIQFKKIDPTVNNTVISTGGGNDLLQDIAFDRIEAVGRMLLERVNSVRTGKMAVIGIHPTRVDSANANKGEVNKRIKAITESLSGCFYDPAELFTLDSSGRASESDMLDSIHYNSTISFNIKDKIQIVCSISL